MSPAARMGGSGPPRTSPKPRTSPLWPADASPKPAPPTSPGVVLTMEDGQRVTVPSHVLRAAVPADKPKEGQLFIFDSGWGGVDMAVKLAKEGHAVIIHIKNSFAGFPKDALEEQLRGMPGGSHLEMRATVNGVNLIAIGSKYNSKKTQFHVATEGAGSTAAGKPYISQYHDELGNVLTRDVARPAVVSRYFGKFNKVDIHDHLRQHQLALEEKWVGKDEKAGKFRMWATIRGVTAIDTMLAVKTHSHRGHSIRQATTREFIDLLAEEMVDNEIDGSTSRPTPAKRSRPVSGDLDMPAGSGPTHDLQPIGYISEVRVLKPDEKDALVQLRCTVCNKKASTYCTLPACDRAAVCASLKRGCFKAHCSNQPPSETEPRARASGGTKRKKRPLALSAEKRAPQMARL
jgi:hypothetical protein